MYIFDKLIFYFRMDIRISCLGNLKKYYYLGRIFNISNTLKVTYQYACHLRLNEFYYVTLHGKKKITYYFRGQKI